MCVSLPARVMEGVRALQDILLAGHSEPGSEEIERDNLPEVVRPGVAKDDRGLWQLQYPRSKFQFNVSCTVSLRHRPQDAYLSLSQRLSRVGSSL